MLTFEIYLHRSRATHFKDQEGLLRVVMGLGSWFKETKDKESQSVLKTQQSIQITMSSFKSHMIKDKGRVFYFQTFISKQPPKSLGKGTLIHFFSQLFSLSCRTYIFFFLFTFFSGILICNEQVYPFPHTYFRQLPPFFCFSITWFESPKHSSTKFLEQGQRYDYTKVHGQDIVGEERKG